MILTLSRWLSVSNGLSTWVTVVGIVSVWYVLLWGVGKLLIRHRIRPARVIILTRSALFLGGAIFVFNLAFVPVVLIAFHGVAAMCLGICMFAALLYLIRVNDQPRTTDPYDDF
jgi:hypothetical protein